MTTPRTKEGLINRHAKVKKYQNPTDNTNNMLLKQLIALMVTYHINLKSTIMREITRPMLALLLFTNCFSVSTYGQSSQRNLDQWELMRQFIGSWQGETGKDTTAIWEVIPYEEGYEHIIKYQTKGDTYKVEKGFIGFTSEDQSVILIILRPNGMLHTFLGKFVSDKKIIWERYNYNHTILLAYVEMIFETPDNIKEIIKWKGYTESWDEVKVQERIYTRIKKT